MRLNLSKTIKKPPSLTLSEVFLFLLISVYFGCSDVTPIMLIVQVMFYVSTAMTVLSRRMLLIHDAFKFYVSWAFILLFLCLLSTTWSVNASSTVQYTISMFQVILSGLCLMFIDPYTDIERIFPKAAIFGCIILSIRMYVTSAMSSLGTERIGTEIEGIHVNTIALNMLIATMLAFSLFVEKKKVRYLFLTLFFIVVIVLTGSKKAIILAPTAVIMMFFVQKSIEVETILKKIRGYAIAIAVIIAIALVVIQTPLISSIALERMQGFINYLSGSGSVDASTLERTIIMERAVKVFYEHPIIGVGLNGYRYASGVLYRGGTMYAHNNYLEILTGLGIIGFIVYYSAYIKIVVCNFKNVRRNQRKAVRFIFIVTLLLLEITSVSYYLEAFHLFLAYILLFSINGERDKKYRLSLIE